VLNQGKATSLAFTVPQSRRFPCALTTNQNGRLLGTIRTIVAGIARVVQAVRDRAKKRNPETNPNGDFDTIHVRRNDWATQYPAYVVSPDELFIATEPELTPGRTVYIATDEQDRDYFRPMANAYDIVYLDDFKNELGDLNTNFYVFVDQLVAARGKVFFGVFHSTFTGYINRLRGYYSVKEKRDGYQDGIIESYHYAGQKEKNYYRSYRAFSVPAFPGIFFPLFAAKKMACTEILFFLLMPLGT